MPVKRLWIIFLCSLIWAAFSKIECEHCFEYNLFPFSELKMTWSIYLWNVCINIVPVAYVWTLLSLEHEKPKELKMASWIIAGHGIDFLFRCNESFFHIGVYPISYDTLMFVLLGLVVLKATLQNEQ